MHTATENDSSKADELLTAFLSLERDAISPNGVKGDVSEKNVTLRHRKTLKPLAQ